MGRGRGRQLQSPALGVAPLTVDELCSVDAGAALCTASHAAYAGSSPSDELVKRRPAGQASGAAAPSGKDVSRTAQQQAKASRPYAGPFAFDCGSGPHPQLKIMGKVDTSTAIISASNASEEFACAAISSPANNSSPEGSWQERLCTSLRDDAENQWARVAAGSQRSKSLVSGSSYVSRMPSAVRSDTGLLQRGFLSGERQNAFSLCSSEPTEIFADTADAGTIHGNAEGSARKGAKSLSFRLYDSKSISPTPLRSIRQTPTPAPRRVQPSLAMAGSSMIADQRAREILPAGTGTEAQIALATARTPRGAAQRVGPQSKAWKGPGPFAVAHVFALERFLDPAAAEWRS